MLIRRLRYWLQSGKRAAALREEMELHIQEKAAELRDRGFSESDALAEARRRFGNLGLKQEEAREIWIARCWSEIWQDMRYGARTLAAQPGFTFAAVATLVLGIGVNAILFNVYNALALAPWAIRNAGETVQLWSERGPGNWGGFSWPHVRYFQEHAQSFAGLAAFTGNEFRVNYGDLSWDAETVTVSANYFDVLGTGFALGRGFSAAAGDMRNPAPEAVLQHETWLTRFGGDSGVIGRSIEVGGNRLEVVGVAASGFHGAAPQKPELWIPAAWASVLLPGQRTLNNPDFCCISVIGRLRPNIARVNAQAELNTLGAQYLLSTGQDSQGLLLTTPSFLANPERSGQFSAVFLPVAVAFFLVLLLACANVSNLQLARGTARRREIGVRLSLGASRGRILRQLLVESFLLSAIAGMASLMVSAWAPGRIFAAIAGSREHLAFRFDNDLRVYAFVLLATFAAAILSGLAPALSTVRGGAFVAIREGRGVTPTGRMRSLLLTSQVALCAILLSGTMLLIRSLDHLRQMDIGINPGNLIVMSTGLDTSGAGDEEGRVLMTNLSQSIGGLPGIESVAWTNTVPLGENFNETSVTDPRSQERIDVGLGLASANFFETLGIPLAVGRSFLEAGGAATNTVIANEAMAQRLWPGESPIGKTLQWTRPLEVIGVVRNFSTQGFGSEHDPYMWIASPGSPSSTILIRHSGPAGPLLNDLPKRARDLDRRFLASAVPYSQTIAEARRGSEISATTASVLGILSLLVAFVGIYGVAAYNVSQRTQEMGVRMALGAQRRAILAMVLKQNLRVVLVGAVVGIAGAIAFGRLLASLLYGVQSTDALALLITLSIILSTSTLAAWGPARRCSRIDPAITLRHE